MAVKPEKKAIFTDLSQNTLKIPFKQQKKAKITSKTKNQPILTVKTQKNVILTDLTKIQPISPYSWKSYVFQTQNRTKNTKINLKSEAFITYT